MATNSKASRDAAFKDIIATIKNSDKQVILIAESPERITRKIKTLVLLDELVRAGKVELRFWGDGLVIDKNSKPSDLVRWDMGVMFAKIYIQQISELTKRGIARRKSLGAKNK